MALKLSSEEISKSHSGHFWTKMADNEQLQKKRCWKPTRNFSLGSVWFFGKWAKHRQSKMLHFIMRNLRAFSIADVLLIFCLKYFVPGLAGVWRGECPKALIFLSSLSKISFGIPQNKKQNFQTLPSPTRLSFPSNLKQKPWEKIKQNLKNSACVDKKNCKKYWKWDNRRKTILGVL